MLSNVVDRKNVGMIQGGDGPRLLFKSVQSTWVTRERFRNDFYSYITAETRITSAIYVPHAARANGDDNFVRTEFSTCGQHFSCEL